jgi:hypothetical protein
MMMGKRAAKADVVKTYLVDMAMMTMRFLLAMIHRE